MWINIIKTLILWTYTSTFVSKHRVLWDNGILHYLWISQTRAQYVVYVDNCTNLKFQSRGILPCCFSTLSPWRSLGKGHKLPRRVVWRLQTGSWFQTRWHTLAIPQLAHYQSFRGYFFTKLLGSPVEATHSTAWLETDSQWLRNKAVIADNILNLTF